MKQLNKTILLLIINILLLLSFVYFKEKSLIITAIVLLLTTIYLIKKYKFKKESFNKEKNYFYLVLASSLAFLILFYLISLKTGYSINYSVFYKNYLRKLTIILTIFIIVLTEIIRYINSYILTDKENKTKALLLILFILIDIIISNKAYGYYSFSQIYTFITVVLLQSIMKNTFLNYLVKESGIKSCLIYRVIIDMYIFVIPILPSINSFLEGVLFMLYPYFLYELIEILMVKKLPKMSEYKKSKKKLNDYVIVIIFIGLVYLISCQFTYNMIAIGTESMTGTINKGDAIIYKKYKNQKLSKGDIIVFKKNGTLIIHRIIKINYGEFENTYITKGDYNKEKDDWVIYEEDIEGVKELTIKYIGIPSVLLSELMQ